LLARGKKIQESGEIGLTDRLVVTKTPPGKEEMTDRIEPAGGLPRVETAAKPASLIRNVTVMSLAASVLSLLLFAWIGESVMLERTITFDLYVRAWVHQHASPALTRAMIATSFMGEDGVAMVTVVALVLFLRYRWRRAALWLVLSLAGAVVMDVTLKLAFHRSRPEPYFVTLPDTYSFPSGHALVSFCFYMVLAWLLADKIRSKAV